MGTWPWRLSHSIILQLPAWNGAESGGWGGGWLCRFEVGWRKQDRRDGRGHLNERGSCQPKGDRSKSQLCIGSRQHRGVHKTVQSWMFQRPQLLRSGSKGPKNHPADGRRHKTHSAAFYLHRLCGSLWVSVAILCFFVIMLSLLVVILNFLVCFLNSSWYSWEALWSFCVSFWLFLSVYDPFEFLPGCFVFLCCTECVWHFAAEAHRPPDPLSLEPSWII